MKTKQKTIFLRIVVVIILIISFFLPSIKSFINQAMNREFLEKVNKYALSANIKIVQQKHRTEGDSSSTSVSAGASGVIIRKKGNKYYALTAEHVVRELDNVDKTKIIVMGYDYLDFKDYLNKGGKYQGIINYYQQFPEAKVEHSNDKYDLAIISFISDEVYKVLQVADEIPKYGDIVASMSNPSGKRNIVTAGKVSSRKPRPFGDEAGKIQYSVIRHTAILSEGSSGSALLNEDLEVVGINLGGNENLFRKFISGMAMPSDRIRAFLEEWKNYNSTL